MSGPVRVRPRNADVLALPLTEDNAEQVRAWCGGTTMRVGVPVFNDRGHRTREFRQVTAVTLPSGGPAEPYTNSTTGGVGPTLMPGDVAIRDRCGRFHRCSAFDYGRLYEQVDP
jgi:hypothetical protein